jgi:hypothetical protein
MDNKDGFEEEIQIRLPFFPSSMDSRSTTPSVTPRESLLIPSILLVLRYEETATR